MELWLIRHPRPQVAPGICYGQADLAVAAAEAAATSRRLQTLLPGGGRLRTSPASRCRDLARRLHEAPMEDARLLERSFGAWEGLAWEAIDRAAIDAWAADPWDFAPPGGESARGLLARVAAALGEETAAAGRAVWITHQGVARAAAGLLLQLPADEWMRLELPFGGAWQLIEEKGKWVRKKEIAAGD